MKLYLWLLNLYPARFREEYQWPMERQFRDEYREARGLFARSGLWLRALSDLMTSVPVELSRELTRDLKYSLRVYRRRSVNAILAVAALGFAIGASTAVFSVLNALLLRSLPFTDPAQLVELQNSPVSAAVGRAAFTQWSERNAYLQGAASFSTAQVNLSGKREALRVKVAETTANFFQVLGTNPAVGRTFAKDEDMHGRNAVAVISYHLWQEFFGGVPDVAGASLRVNDAIFTVIGVAPLRFDYPGNTSLWTPAVFDFERVPKSGALFFQTIGRLKSDLGIAQARALLNAEVRGTDRPVMISLRDQLAGSVREASWILAGLILLVLLAACANVAHLLLSRTAERRTELAVRAALGASRARLLQQLVTEATALTAAGALLGLVVAHWAVQVAATIVPAQLATQAYTVLDWRVLGFAAVLALVTGVVFGVVPAWLVGRLLPSEHLMRTRTGTPEMGTKRMRAGLVALQAGLTLTLVTSSVAMGRTLVQLLNADLGLRPANAVTLSVSLHGTKYRKGAARWQYYSEALDRLRAVPGVESAGAVSYVPLANNAFMANPLTLDSGQTAPQALMNAAMPGYFQAAGTTLLAGREFEAGDGRRSSPAVIVNEAFAQSVGLGTSVLGRKLKGPWNKTQYSIVGVVETTRFAGPAYPGVSQVFWPVEEEPAPTLTFVARVHGRADELLAACGQAIRGVDREVPVYDVKTLDQRLSEVLARPRFYTTATAFLAALAVLLAAVGIYGAASYSVAQRKHEMGLRMALGASQPRVRALVVRENLLPLAYGMVAGVAGAMVAGRYLESLVVHAQPVDLWTCVTGALLLLFGGSAAAWIATNRVLQIAPADALRAE